MQQITRHTILRQITNENDFVIGLFETTYGTRGKITTFHGELNTFSEELLINSPRLSAFFILKQKDDGKIHAIELPYTRTQNFALTNPIRFEPPTLLNSPLYL
jgi:hypothetical protein